LIDKNLEGTYNSEGGAERKEAWKEKLEARGDLASAKLTTRYNEKVEFSKNLFGLPFQACPDGQQKIGRPKARKEVVLSA